MDNASTMCPKHPHQRAVMTCARCGTFACMTCKSTVDDRQCADCTTHYAAVNIDVGGVLQEAFTLLSNHRQAVAAFSGAHAIFGLMMLPLILATGGGQPFGSTEMPDLGRLGLLILASVIGSLIYTAITYSVFIRFLGDVLEGTQRAFGEVMRAALGYVPLLIVLNIILGLVVGFGMLACVVPGFFLGVRLIFSVPALVLEPAGPFDALSISWNRTSGHFWNLFIVLFIGGAILVGIGMLSLMVQFLLARFGTPGIVAHTLLQYALNGVGTALFLTLAVLCYQRLSGRWIHAGRGATA